MKKFLSVIAVLAIIAACFSSFAACNQTKLLLIDVELTGEQYGYCVTKTDTTLLASVNTFLAKIKEDGTLDALYEKYDSSKNADYASITGIGSDVATTSTNAANELIVATNTEFEPFEYKNGANFCGIDMEVAKLLATELGKTLVVMDMKFDAVVNSVETGICNIGMAGLTISDDRAETVTFSEPYYGTTQMIVVKSGDTTFDGCTTKEEVEAKLKTLEGKKAGAQVGTTGFYYINGSEDFGFDGYANITMKAYDAAALAATDMINGNIDFIVVDKDPAKALVAKMNA